MLPIRNDLEKKSFAAPSRARLPRSSIGNRDLCEPMTFRVPDTIVHRKFPVLGTPVHNYGICDIASGKLHAKIF